jgi:hypothetical protein
MLAASALSKSRARICNQKVPAAALSFQLDIVDGFRSIMRDILCCSLKPAKRDADKAKYHY